MFDMPVHPDWGPFWSIWRDRAIKALSLAAADDSTPPVGAALRFLTRPCRSISVIILGQDPYPSRGVATGRAFEAGNLRDWNEPFRQSSLKNIVRAVYRCYTGKTASFAEIRKMDQGDFPLLPPYRLFQSWEEQGVLLLNASLTCRVGCPGSHRALWRPFTEALVAFLDQTRGGALCWFLWGGDAASYGPLIRRGKIYRCRHPMMCGLDSPDDFLRCPCFAETADRIDWRGLEQKDENFA